MADLLVRRWCTWCRKDNHNDAQCWSTRPADWRPDQVAVPVPVIPGCGPSRMVQAFYDWLSDAGRL